MKLPFRSIFAESIEESARLRLLTLAMTWVAGAAMGSVGGSALVWIGGPLVATFGHAFSWYTRAWRLPIWPLLLLMPITGISALIASAIPSALSGNWLPVTYYLLLLQTVASFYLRTRGGLYAAHLLGATVLILTSQLAFGFGFLLFMGGFIFLLFIFLASSATVDATRATLARVTWAAPVRLATWVGCGGGVVGLGAVLFFLLPWSTVQGGASPTDAVLPLTGDAYRPTSQYQVGALPSGDAIILEDNLAQQLAPIPQRLLGGFSPSINATDVDDAPGENPSATFQASSAGSPSLDIAPEKSETSSVSRLIEDEEVVMRVRSPIASYWRGRTVSLFDGRRWHSDTRVSLDQAMPRSVTRRYTQTYYLATEQSTPLFGYSPVQWLLFGESRSVHTLDKGTVYQVVSQLRDFDPPTLRRAALDLRPRTSGYGRIPPSVRTLAEKIVGQTVNPLDKALQITRYLRSNYTYTPSVGDLYSARPVEQFLLGIDHSGSSFDFASANALLARAVGLNARVVTGYLPGELDPFSGTYIVRRRDAHAWVEIKFPDAGWVPFDASPRRDLPGFTRSNVRVAGIVGKVFEWRLGDDLRLALGNGIAALKTAAAGSLTWSGITIATAILLAGAGMLRLQRRRRVLRETRCYSRLPGKERMNMLATYERMEKLLLRSRIARRQPTETLVTYFARAMRGIPHLQTDLEWLCHAITAAAYRQATPTQEWVAQAQWRLRRMKSALRGSGSA